MISGEIVWNRIEQCFFSRAQGRIAMKWWTGNANTPTDQQKTDQNRR